MLRRYVLFWFSAMALLVLVDCNASSSDAQSFLDAFQAVADAMEVRLQRADASQFRPAIMTTQPNRAQLNLVS